MRMFTTSSITSLFLTWQFLSSLPLSATTTKILPTPKEIGKRKFLPTPKEETKTFCPERTTPSPPPCYATVHAYNVSEEAGVRRIGCLLSHPDAKAHLAKSQSKARKHKLLAEEWEAINSQVRRRGKKQWAPRVGSRGSGEGGAYSNFHDSLSGRSRWSRVGLVFIRASVSSTDTFTFWVWEGKMSREGKTKIEGRKVETQGERTIIHISAIVVTLHNSLLVVLTISNIVVFPLPLILTYLICLSAARGP